jgi:hypothetical protein
MTCKHSFSKAQLTATGSRPRISIGPGLAILCTDFGGGGVSRRRDQHTSGIAGASSPSCFAVFGGAQGSGSCICSAWVGHAPKIAIKLSDWPKEGGVAEIAARRPARRFLRAVAGTQAILYFLLLRTRF